MGVYTHIGLHDQSTAIELLPAPPELIAGKVVTAQGNGNGKVKSSNGEFANGRHSTLAADVGQPDSLWLTLPDNIKVGILAMISTAGGKG